MIEPIDHFAQYETVPASITEVRGFIRDVEAAGRRLDADVYWRGQVDNRWGVTSSLARLSETPTGLTDADLRTAESAIVKEAARWVTSLTVTPTNELEWLALLQHMSVPTRLVDFTPDPLVAMFFAVESMDHVDGRLFAILIPKRHSRVSDPEAAAFEFSSLRTGEIRLWEPPRALSPRVAAQRGVFALSRLPSTSPPRTVRDPETGPRPMLRAEVVSVMSIPLAIADLADPSHPYRQGVRTYTARIHVSKAAIREQLSLRARKGDLRPNGAPIDYAYCYPDVEGMLRYSQVLARLRRGI